LCHDGVLMMQFVEEHVGRIVARHILTEVFHRYLEALKKKVAFISEND
jgi:hypothetical protein